VRTAPFYAVTWIANSRGSQDSGVASSSGMLRASTNRIAYTRSSLIPSNMKLQTRGLTKVNLVAYPGYQTGRAKSARKSQTLPPLCRSRRSRKGLPITAPCIKGKNLHILSYRISTIPQRTRRPAPAAGNAPLTLPDCMWGNIIANCRILHSPPQTQKARPP
jgi:hypothetical protein